MSRLRTELKLRALRAQLGARFRRGLPVVGNLRHAVIALEQQTARADLDYLRDRLQTLLQDWRLSLLVRANPWLILQRELYAQSAQRVGPALLGNIILTGDARAARITEVVASDRPPAAGVLARMRGRRKDWAGRLCMTEHDGIRQASILCGEANELSTLTLTGIQPLEGCSLMAGACGVNEESADMFHGGSVACALGLTSRHHGLDLTRRQSAIRIASILQASPLAVGKASAVKTAAREWRWRIPAALLRHD